MIYVELSSLKVSPVEDMKVSCFLLVAFHIFDVSPRIPMESHESMFGFRRPSKLIPFTPLLRPSLAYLLYPEVFLWLEYSDLSSRIPPLIL
jgi:hypothetical protein